MNSEEIHRTPGKEPFRRRLIMSLLIRNALIDHSLLDIFITGGVIEKIGPSLQQRAETVLDAEGMVAIPSFVNGHTHSAMTLLRGYADDMFLQEWLEKKIWPLEAKLTEEDVYFGAKLACLEMIRSGTTLFNDMYWHWRGTARAVEEMGIRAVVGAALIDRGSRELNLEQFRKCEELFAESKDYSKRVLFSLGPHTIYTVSEECLFWCREFAEKHNLLIHLHLSETEKEVLDCQERHKLRPVEYLEKIGILSHRLVLAHCVWLGEGEIELLKRHEARVVHNPVSNMKLAVGGALPYRKLKEAGVIISLGTDGCSSNNNLDMLETMKCACLLQKYETDNSSILSVNEAMDMATRGGARTFNIKIGKIAPGYLADLLLINLKRPEMTPCHNIVSNLVYAANGYCIDTVICNGAIVMKGRRVEGEDEILAKARETARRLCQS
jgi:5-methylthioadenosine/S-adenosylhomocysteine deaminase